MRQYRENELFLSGTCLSEHSISVIFRKWKEGIKCQKQKAEENKRKKNFVFFNFVDILIENWQATVVEHATLHC